MDFANASKNKAIRQGKARVRQDMKSSGNQRFLNLVVGT